MAGFRVLLVAVPTALLAVTAGGCASGATDEGNAVGGGGWDVPGGGVQQQQQGDPFAQAQAGAGAAVMGPTGSQTSGLGATAGAAGAGAGMQPAAAEEDMTPGLNPGEATPPADSLPESNPNIGAAAGTGGAPAGTNNPPAAGDPGGTQDTAGGGATTTPPISLGPGESLPPVSDYEAPGPFATIEVDLTGPGGAYTMHRPQPLGEGGFLHPILTWGNGITTTPAIYPILLSTIASHGIVVIASDSSAVTSADMTAGLDWLVSENDNPSSDLYQKLDTSRGVAMGYSLGGGASVGASAHPSVITTISMHPAPGFGILPGPILLFSGTNDTVCVPEAFVQPIYDGAQVPAVFAILEGADHLEPVLTGGRELGPSIAWLRMQLYGDDGGRDYFYGANCKLCGSPWASIQRKNGFE